MTTLNKTDLATIVAKELEITKKDALAVTETVSKTMELLKNRETVQMPLFLKKTHRGICEVSLRDSLRKAYIGG